MKVLEEEYGLIKKKRPIRANNTSKTVRYEINDSFFVFGSGTSINIVH